MTPALLAQVYMAFQAHIVLRRPRGDEDSPSGPRHTCALNRGDLTCVVFSRGIPAVFSVGRVPCPDRVAGP